MGKTELHLYGVRRLIRHLMTRLDQANQHNLRVSRGEMDVSHFYARDSRFAEMHVGFLKERLAGMLGKRVEDLTLDDLR